MIDHIGLAVSDMERSKAFYSNALKPLGIGVIMEVSAKQTGGDAHAGHTETSLLLHISPTDVLTDRWLTGNPAPLPELLGSMRRSGVAAVSPVGILGDPTTATAAEGRRIFSEMVDGCVRRVARWAPGSDGMLT